MLVPPGLVRSVTPPARSPLAGNSWLNRTQSTNALGGLAAGAKDDDLRAQGRWIPLVTPAGTQGEPGQPSGQQGAGQ